MSEAPGIADSEGWVDGWVHTVRGTGTKLQYISLVLFKTSACTLFNCLSAAQYRICRILVIAILFNMCMFCMLYIRDVLSVVLYVPYCPHSTVPQRSKLFMHLLIY